jgi:DNA-binding response OmpR family regulator
MERPGPAAPSAEPLSTALPPHAPAAVLPPISARSAVLLIGPRVGELSAYGVALQSMDLVVTHVEDVVRALRVASAIQLDAVIVDDRIPASDGAHLARELKERGNHAKIVMLEQWLKRDRGLGLDSTLSRVLAPSRLAREIRGSLRAFY